MIKRIISWYTPGFARSLVYMLQASEYRVADYLAWFWRARDLRRVETRKKLVMTKKATLLFIVAWIIVLFEIGLFLLFAALGVTSRLMWWGWAVAVAVAAPLITAHVLALPLWLGDLLIKKPREKKIIAEATRTIRAHRAVRIGIAGSYGKTTFKEMLATILATGKKVAATPGNMNTPLGISRFVAKLQGDEDVLIFEMGEYYPGDIAELCQMVRPEIGVITGINEAHLSKFKTLERTTATIYELADFVGDKPVYKNGDNPLVRQKSARDPLLYSAEGVHGWKVSGVTDDMEGVRFTVKKGTVTIKVHSQLLGVQNVGPLVACIDIARSLGLTPGQIETGIANTKSYEHRMEPKKVGAAWVIDDTYNGNSDGVKAGIAWLKKVPAKRRIYVTPGLVEQGARTRDVHYAMGKQLAEANIDVVVLMKNSTTTFIEEGLKDGGFAGRLQVIADPLQFYANIEHFVAAGDVLLMQNDWTDNYA